MSGGLTCRPSATTSGFPIDVAPSTLCPRPKGQLKFVCSIVAGVHLLIGLLYVAFLYSLFNKEVPTHLGSSDLTRVQRLLFHVGDLRQTPELGAVSYCASNCAYFNPSLVLWRERWIFTVREGTRHKCGGLGGTTAFALSQVRPKYSSVVLGELPLGSIDAPDSAKLQIYISSRMPDAEPRRAENSHFGQEDPRLIAHGAELFILSASERHAKPRMFLTRVADVSGRDGRDVKYGATVELVPKFPGAAYSQKNWMYLPVYETPSEALFVSDLSPLTILRVDVATGAANLEHQSVELPAGSDGGEGGLGEPKFTFRGSSPFLPLNGGDGSNSSSGLGGGGSSNSSSEATVFIGLAHQAEASGADLGTLKFPSYYTYFVVLERYPEWRISHVSPPIALPKAVGAAVASRITFATTLISWRDEYIVAFGDMDCESYMLRLSQDTVMAMLEEV